MDPATRRAVAEALDTEVTAATRLAGGDINDAHRVVLADHRQVFVKSNRTAPAALFACEARGLAWLAEPGALRIPAVLAASRPDDPGPHILVLEYLAGAPRAPDHDERLGRGLAALHAAGAEHFGLDHDNFIATLEQDNTPSPSWPAFYAERRLEPQVRRAVERGVAPGSWVRDFDRLYRALPDRVGPAEPPARLHGDLWSGNLHVDDRGQPALIDPAVYGGHREIDLAMLTLFGSPGSRFFAAYDEAYPRAPGHAERSRLYQLYPLLVHVNLFGASYVAQTTAALRRYL